jgi:hypothetical protein
LSIGGHRTGRQAPALVKWSWRPFWGCRRCDKSRPVATHRRVGAHRCHIEIAILRTKRGGRCGVGQLVMTRPTALCVVARPDPSMGGPNGGSGAYAIRVRPQQPCRRVEVGPAKAWGHPRPRGSAFGVLPGEVPRQRGQRIISARTPVPYPRMRLGVVRSMPDSWGANFALDRRVGCLPQLSPPVL